MKLKSKLKGMVICLAVCFTMLCGDVLVSHAVAPCEPYDHNWGYVRMVGKWVVEVEKVSIGGHLYELTHYYDMQLQRCECGRERVVPRGSRKTHQEFIK